MPASPPKQQNQGYQSKTWKSALKRFSSVRKQLSLDGESAAAKEILDALSNQKMARREYARQLLNLFRARALLRLYAGRSTDDLEDEYSQIVHYVMRSRSSAEESSIDSLPASETPHVLKHAAALVAKLR